MRQKRGVLEEGVLELPDGRLLNGLRMLNHQGEADTCIPEPSKLTYLACIDTVRVPLYLVGSILSLSAEESEAHEWLTERILNAASDLSHSSNWQGPVAHEALTKSLSLENALLPRIGLLFRVDPPTSSTDSLPYPITEILFFAKRPSPNSSDLTIHVLPISSHLLDLVSSTPPQTSVGASISAWPPFPATNASASPPATRKHHLESLFSTADDRRRKARRKGGASISLAASKASGPSALTSPQIQSPSSDADAGSSINVLQARQARPNAATPTTASRARSSPAPGTTPPIPRPPSRPAAEGRKRSALSHVRTPDEEAAESFAARNKHAVSKTVMACMRMWGLETSQRRGKVGDGSVEGSGMESPGGESQAGERGEDEYKAVYHQTYKGAVFALRGEMEGGLVRADAVREVVERLLGVFVGGDGGG